MALEYERSRNGVRHIAVLAALLVLSACATLTEDRQYDRHQMISASVIARPDLRYHPESKRTQQNNFGALSEWAYGLPILHDGTFDVLALSSGGPDGAFSAAGLNAWTASGSRPDFEVVTGVSTGTLIASFAFVGSKYDETIKNFYTSDEVKNALGPLRPIAALAGKGAYGTQNLTRLMDKYITWELLGEIAAKHADGHRLFMVTGNYDAQEPVIWNMGKIASLGTPEAMTLYKQIIKAAVAVPVAFEPVPIKVTINGKEKTELHGDAGPVKYFYADSELVPPQYRNRAHIYVMLNKIYKPKVEPMKASVGKITTRAINEFTHTGMQNQLRLDWDEARNAQIKFQYAHLPFDHELVSSVDFRIEYMRATYNSTYQSFADGKFWHTARP